LIVRGRKQLPSPSPSTSSCRCQLRPYPKQPPLFGAGHSTRHAASLAELDDLDVVYPVAIKPAIKERFRLALLVAGCGGGGGSDSGSDEGSNGSAGATGAVVRTHECKSRKDTEATVCEFTDDGKVEVSGRGFRDSGSWSGEGNKAS